MCRFRGRPAPFSSPFASKTAGRTDKRNETPQPMDILRATDSATPDG
jgi:hypothetical protein